MVAAYRPSRPPRDTGAADGRPDAPDAYTRGCGPVPAVPALPFESATVPDHPLLQGLNPEQRAAVLHDGGPLLVVAGAGSGKTRVLTHRIAHLIQERGVHPFEVLAITFTNKAADEMKGRVGRLVGDDLVGVERDADGNPVRRRWGGMWVQTFHSACARLLRSEAERLGYTRSFSIYDTTDSARVVNQVISELGLDPRKIPVRGALGAISTAKNELIDFETFAEQARTWWDEQVAEVYRAYAERLHRQSAMDFDDLLVRAVELFELFDDVRDRYRRQFRHVLVDEWQDTNRAQYRLVQLLAEEHRNVCVVGDGDQCLPAGTLVATPTGEVPIEALAVGDQVLGTTGGAALEPATVGHVKVGDSPGRLVTVRCGDLVLRGTAHHVVPTRWGELDRRWMVALLVGGEDGPRLVVGCGADPPFTTPGGRGRKGERDDTQLWVVRDYATREEAERAASVIAARYHLPFRRPKDAWEVDAEGGAKLLLSDLDLHPEHPHRIGRHVDAVDLAMFAGEVAGTVAHRVAWNGVERCSVLRRRYHDAVDLARRLARTEGRPIRRTAQIDGQTWSLQPLSHLHVGMELLVRDATGRLTPHRIDAIHTQPHQGPVYDLQVEGAHTYVADGVLVHNSIYAFRGADVRNLLEFEKDFPDATRIVLDRNYRSTQTILDAANAVIAHNRRRIPKELRTDAGAGPPIVRYAADNEHDEAAFVVEEVQRLGREHGIPPGDCAIFYRTNAQSRVLEEVLNRLGLPYQVIGSVRFYERKEIKDVVAYLQLLVNPADDVALARVLNVPRRGIGDRTAEALARFAGRERIPLMEACRRAAEVPGLAARAVGAVEGFVLLVDHLRTAWVEEGLGPRRLIELVLDRTGYRAELEAEHTPEAEGRLENLEELLSAADELLAATPDATLAEFLERVALVNETDTMAGGADDQPSSKITLMTLHNAKGLEFPVVFLAGMEESVFPHHRTLSDPDQLEEERRLAYVGMTRAEQRLYLTSAWSRTLFGATHSNPPSRFLAEVPAHLVDDRSDDRGGPSRRALARVGVQSQYRRSVPDDDDGDFKPGDRVIHSRLGAGRILELHGGADDAEAVIDFDDGGVKRLVLAYAPLVRA